jgi:hypothetical protein
MKYYDSELSVASWEKLKGLENLRTIRQNEAVYQGFT